MTAALDGRRPLAAPEALRPFVDAGVLAAADVHVARVLARLAGPPPDDAALLAAALAVRAPRLGHVCVDLARVAASVDADPGGDAPGDAAGLPWPPAAAWPRACAAWGAVGTADGPARPLRLAGTRLYLDRMHADEVAVADALRRRAATPGAPAPDATVALAGSLLAGEDAAEQRAAALAIAARPLTVVAGGPGTGKTTTVARALSLMDAAEPLRPELIALAAPTGKAAARLAEAVREEAARAAPDPAARARLSALAGTTLHRLLGRRPDSESRFRHHAGYRLPHRLVVVDETSMVSLALMARLLEALRDDARLVLVGDPEQLASVEAGTVLGDIVGPARATRPGTDAGDGPAGAPWPRGAIAMLRRAHRFGGAIAALADAVRRGDGDDALAVLAAGDPAVRWLEGDAGEHGVREALRERTVAAAAPVMRAAAEGRAPEAVAGLAAFRLLVAHRRGPHGVGTWNALVEGWLAAHGAVPGWWYPGRPVLVTANQHALRLYNGDVGVIVARDGAPPAAAFPRGDGTALVAPGRLGDIAPVHAMTIHASQGSQFGAVAVVLPPAGSPLLTRELLYTAITRARGEVLLAGTADAVRGAVARPVARASGLGIALWGGGGETGVDIHGTG